MTPVPHPTSSTLPESPSTSGGTSPAIDWSVTACSSTQALPLAPFHRSFCMSLPYAPPMAYEYKTDVLTHGFLGRKDEELDRGELENKLNELGAEGWEFDKLIENLALHGEKDGHLLIFRRAR